VTFCHCDDIVNGAFQQYVIRKNLSINQQVPVELRIKPVCFSKRARHRGIAEPDQRKIEEVIGGRATAWAILGRTLALIPFFLLPLAYGMGLSSQQDCPAENPSQRRMSAMVDSEATNPESMRIVDAVTYRRSSKDGRQPIWRIGNSNCMAILDTGD